MTDNLKEALEFFDQNPDCAPNVNGHFNAVLDAARQFAEIYPSLCAILEARAKASKGEWSTKYSEDTSDYENEDWILYADGENICAENYYSSPGLSNEVDAKFTVTAANEIAKIAEVLKEPKL